MVCDRFALEDASIPVTIRQALNSPPKKQVRDAQQRLWQASSNGLVEVESSGMKKLWTGEDGLPILSLTGVALGPDGRLWLATRQGAICFQPDAPAGQQWFYFWGKRYLSDNRVAQIVAEKELGFAHKPVSHESSSSPLISNARVRCLLHACSAGTIATVIQPIVNCYALGTPLRFAWRPAIMTACGQRST